MGTYTEHVEKHKYMALLVVLSLVAVLIALLGISYVSLVQTVIAFSDWVDPNIAYVGTIIPWLLGVLFQYGQTAALYIRKVYGNDRPIQNGFPYWLTSNNIALGFFFASAIVDAATNIVWYNTTVIPRAEGNLILYRVIGYVGMSIIVFVEEGTGIVIQAFVRSWREYRSICESERRIISGKTQQPENNRPASQQSQPYSQSRGFRPDTSASKPPSFIPSERGTSSYGKPRPEPKYHPLGVGGDKKEKESFSVNDEELEKFISGLGG
jgi:hypothetical protein